MTWTAPKTWTSEPLASSDLNTHVRDNLQALKDAPAAVSDINEVADYSTNSTSFVDIDATEGKFQHTIITAGGDILVGFHGQFSGAGRAAFLDVSLDGVRQGGASGLISSLLTDTDGRTAISFVYRITGVTAGSHIIKIQWKVGTLAGTITLGALAGTAGLDTKPQMWVMEVGDSTE